MLTYIYIYILVAYLCTHIAVFSMAPQQTAKFQTASFHHFRRTLRKDSVASCVSIWTLFPPSVRGQDGF